VVRRLDALAAEANLPARVVDPLRVQHRERLQQVAYRIGAEDVDRHLARLSRELESRLIDAERRHLFELERTGALKDDARRRIEAELDLREAQLARSDGGSRDV
jgi:hypothetical protein